MLAAVTLPVAAGSSPSAPADPALACAESIVTHWTLPALASQVVVVPVNASQIATMLPAARAGFGGIILFGATAPAGFAATLARIQAATPHGYPMMVMTDEEGGGVQRLTNLVPSLPWAHTMGRTLTTAQIAQLGRRTGTALLRAGVNVDLAPVADVDARAVYPGARDPDGLRSFSGSVASVAADATAFAQGLARARVTAVVKHFPGLGGASANTDDAPAATRPWSVLQTTGLVPFEAAIAAGVPAVMLSNASVPGLTSAPAGISPAVVAALRQQLGFRGLIMTDSLSAGAISAVHLSVPAAALAAIRAGADQVLFGIPRAPATSLGLAVQVRAGIVAAVVTHTLARATLVDAVAHVVLARTALSCPAPSTTSTTMVKMIS